MGLQSAKFGLRPQDDFQVKRDFQLTNHNLAILNRLFTPLVGSSAIGLLHYLNQFVESTSNQVNTHYIIMSELKINLKEFRQQMDILEGIGLVKSFVKHEDNTSSFVYKLVQPPTARQFFSDPMLSIFLYNEVSKQRYHQLKSDFETSTATDLTEFQEITRKYTDVFKLPKGNLVEDVSQMPQESTYKGLDLSAVNFDFETLYDLLQTHFISEEIITQEAKHLIIQLATLYGLTPEAMKRIILKSITSAQQLSFEDIRKYARTYYLMEHEQHLPSLQQKDQITAPKPSAEQNDDDKNWLQQLENTSPIEMLASWSSSEPTTQQKVMVEELVEREKMSFGVINILLQFVMLKEDMKLPKAYILEIASNWKKLGISTAEQAYQHALKVNQPKPETRVASSQSRYKKHQLASKEMTPKWLLEREQQASTESDDNNKKVDNDNNEEEDQERAAFLQHLKERWGEDDE